LIGLLAPRPEEILLDIATGPGVLLAELARSPTRPGRAWGVGSSPEMLSLAPVLPTGWRLSVADATRLPFDDDSFDVITASYLLHVLSVQDRRSVIDEIGRVLRPAGRVGTITIAPPRGPIAAAISAPMRIAARRSGGRFAALRSLDPAPDLAGTGLRELARGRTVCGYPSLCLVAGRELGSAS